MDEDRGHQRPDSTFYKILKTENQIILHERWVCSPTIETCEDADQD